MKIDILSQITKPVAVTILLSLFIMTLFLNSKIVLAETSSNYKSTDLPTDSSNLKVMEALGIDTEQSSRTNLAGSIVDKNKENPLGAYQVFVSKSLQLARAGVGDDFSELYDIFNAAVNKEQLGVPNYNMKLLGTDKLKGSIQDASGDWRKAEKAMVAADIHGSGKDSLIIVSIPQESKDNVKLQLIISDYNNGNSVEKVYTLASSLPKPLGEGRFEYGIQAAAGDFDQDGKDEIGIVVARTLYICEADTNSASILSFVTFDETSNIARVSNGAGDIPAMDVAAGDADKDGFEELIVTTGSSNGGKTYIPHLLIYDNTNATKPCANIELKLGSNSKVFPSPSVEVGDPFHTGENMILVGGRTTNGKVSMTYVKYNPYHEKYDESLTNQIYEFNVNDFKAVKSAQLGLDLVSLKASNEADAMHIIFGGYLYQCMAKSQTFTKRNVTSVYDASRKKVNSEKDSLGNITNTKVNDNTVYIMDTVVGNFDGNTLGKEQILLLHYHQNVVYKNNTLEIEVKGNEYAYLTLCGEDSNGKISTYMDRIWDKEKKTNYNYPAICALYTLDQGIRMEYEQSKFVYSDPMVVSILGASPYYSEIKKTEYKNTWSTALMKSESGAFTINADISFGYSDNSAAYGFMVEGKAFEELIKEKFIGGWKSTLEGSVIEYDLKVNNSKDYVIIATIPYDVYVYNIYHAGVKSQVTINIPYTPIFKSIGLEDYNKIINANQELLPNTPIIGKEVLKHTVGNPRSYPSSVDSISNTAEKSSIVGSDTMPITLSSDRGVMDMYPLNITFDSSDLQIPIGMKGKSTTVSNVYYQCQQGTTLYGSVAQVPKENKDYDFGWKLAMYQYDLRTGSSLHRCTVITYLVNGVSSLPPAVVQGLSATEILSDVISLQWQKVEDAAGYIITRSETDESGYELIGTLDNKEHNQYRDSGLMENKKYYYKVISYSLYEGKTKKAMPSDALVVQTSTVTDITVKTQPKLNYFLGEQIDLSSLSVLLYRNGRIAEEVKYEDFAKNSLTVSINKDQLLTSDYNGEAITITHVPTGITVVTNALKVNTDSMSKFTISAEKVSESKLISNTLFSVNATVKNNTDTSLEVILVIALYDAEDIISDILYVPETIGAREEHNLQGSIKLPMNTADYKTKVFIWDGSDLTTSKQTLLSNVIQIP